MLKIKLTLLLAVLVLSASAQKYASQKSLVTFFSDGAIEDITAKNSQSLGIVDVSNSAVAFSIPIGNFEFEKNLMKEHFNEKYMETEKYPKSTFEGKIAGFNPQQKGAQHVKAKGKLSIHGVTKEVELPGTIEVTAENKIQINSTFMVKLKDYKIKIPKLLWQNLAEQVEVKIDFTLLQK
jgi:polyisoprenoid-binding protein YceI